MWLYVWYSHFTSLHKNFIEVSYMYNSIIYIWKSSLNSDIKKKQKIPQALSQDYKTEDDDIHPDKFAHYMRVIVHYLCGLWPPPHPVHPRPPAFIWSCTQFVNPIYLKKIFSQYMTHDNTILTKRTLQAHTMEKNIILLLLCSWLLLPLSSSLSAPMLLDAPPVVLLSVHSCVLWQSLYKLNQKRPF